MTRPAEPDVDVRLAEPADLAGVARVQVDTWRHAYRGILDAGYLAALTYGRSAEKWRVFLDSIGTRHFLVVAVEPDAGVVGFAAGGPGRSDQAELTGEVYAIYVQPSRQRVGIGRRLFTATGAALRGAGMPGIVVWALRDNPARRFYESLGGTPIREQPIQIGRQTLVEVAYGWPKTDALPAASRPISGPTS